MTPRWRVRLRYRDGRPLPTLERLATAEWLAIVLPKEADVGPVSVLPVNGGWTISLHPCASDTSKALRIAVATVGEVVGDAGRVLGQLVDSDMARVPD